MIRSSYAPKSYLLKRDYGEFFNCEICCVGSKTLLGLVRNVENVISERMIPLFLIKHQ